MDVISDDVIYDPQELLSHLKQRRVTQVCDLHLYIHVCMYKCTACA